MRWWRKKIDRPLEQLALEMRRMNEAGVVVDVRTWGRWPVVAQNLWLVERERVERIRMAQEAQFVLDGIQGGSLAEDAVYPELPDDVQNAILSKRAGEARARNEFFQRLNGVQ